MPQVGLFIPCYVDQLYPNVAMATLKVLERFGCEVDFPAAQTCCGQPMANTGCTADAAPLAKKFVSIFRDYEYIVCPSGSCTAMIRQHYHDLLHDDPDYAIVRPKTFELCEFLTDVLKISNIGRAFPLSRWPAQQLSRTSRIAVGFQQRNDGHKIQQSGPASRRITGNHSGRSETPR